MSQVESQKELQQRLQQETAEYKQLIQENYNVEDPHNSFLLFKMIYKDLSTKYFATFILFITILVVAMIKIYVSYQSSLKTTEFARLQSDYNRLVYYNNNLNLEYLYLTSDTNIRDVLNNGQHQILFRPVSSTKEVIVVIPYTIYHSQLIKQDSK